MTDPLIEIAEEMEYDKGDFDRHLPRGRKAINKWAARIRAIAASKEAYTDPCDVCGTGMFQACPKCDERILNLSPQRKAFYEAAMDFFESRHADDEMDTINERLILADKAYRALVESERGESEGK